MAVQLALGPANRGFTASFERLAENTPEMLGSLTGHLAGAISLVIVKRLETLNGGFKYEVQHGIAIDEIPLRAF